ncbi:hypothetical protein HDU76_007916, partial [Blyttiomyces sp. JEL0837]
MHRQRSTTRRAATIANISTAITASTSGHPSMHSIRSLHTRPSFSLNHIPPLTRSLHSTSSTPAPPSLATTTQHQRPVDALPTGSIRRMDTLGLPSTKHHMKVNMDTVIDLDMNLRAIVNPPTHSHSHSHATTNAHPRHRPSSVVSSPSTTPSTSNSRHSHPQRPVPSTVTSSPPSQTQQQSSKQQQEPPKPQVHRQPHHKHQHIHQNHTHALTLEKYASKEINPLSLKQLINAGKAVSLSKLLNGAAFMREELIVRIAHQIR